MSVEYCVHCREINPTHGGYCWLSPDGAHEYAIDEDTPNPYDCCPKCGAELSQAELDGFAEHVCDPADVAAQATGLGEEDDD